MSDTPVVEVRTYYVKPGYRDRFVDFFLEQSRPLQEQYGMKVMGPFLDVEDQNAIVWLRSFPSHDERERMKDAFESCPEWTGGLRDLGMSMLDHWSVVVTEASVAAVDGALGDHADRGLGA